MNYKWLLSWMFCFVTLSSNSVAKNDVTSRLNKLEKRVQNLEAEVKRLRAAPAGQPNVPEQKNAYRLPVGDSAFMGPANAPVTVTIFFDTQCPFCARVFPLLQDVLKDASLSGKVKVVFKHFPLSFHRDARPAAKALMAAQEQGNTHFVRLLDKMLLHQRELTYENFLEWATDVDLDAERFVLDLQQNDDVYDKRVEADMLLGTSEAKVRGTPSIYVNGWELRQRSVDGVKELIKSKKMLRR